MYATKDKTLLKITTRTREILGDRLTPVETYLKLRDRSKGSVLLETSDAHKGEHGSSFVCIDPLLSFRAKEDEVLIQTPQGEEQRHLAKDEVLPALKETVRRVAMEGEDPLGVNGFFGHFSYDAVRYFEDIEFGKPPASSVNTPDVAFDLYRFILVFDHFRDRLLLLENIPEGEESHLEEIETTIFGTPPAVHPFSVTGQEEVNISEVDFMKNVTHGKEHCHRGDVFQVVFSRRFSQAFSGDEFNVYRALRSINPSPYLFYFDHGDYRLFGSSPEAQLKVKGDRAYIDPIAGTFRRTGDDSADRELAEKLKNDPKENAEHVMLVDLARNDLSRTLKNVEVERFKDVQYFSHVIHMVSRVIGDLSPDTEALDVFAASFPAGTLSGAPKYKAMELIDRYETERRGYYGGSIGYIGLNGDLDQAITIRSFLSQNKHLYYQAGAGIVSDSQEEKELAEVNNKLGALKQALEYAQTLK